MCLRPIQVKVTSRTFGITRIVDAPCGKCMECLKRRQNDWKLRIMHESQYWNNLFFFTLTYDNDSLPCRLDYSDELGEPLFVGSYNSCLKFQESRCLTDVVIRSSACKREIQNFLKALREDVSRKLSSRLNMKYFICAEYGPNPKGTRRPHYHGVIMTNVDYNTLFPYFAEWRDSKGRIDFKQVGLGRQDKSKVANYISKYCAKGCFESRQEDISLGLIEKAWYIMSKGIAERWLEDNRGYWEKYVPTCLSIKGDYTLEDVEKFFSVKDFAESERCDLISKFYPKHLGRSEVLNNLIARGNLARKCFDEINKLIDSFFIFDGDSYRYKMPRFYRERLLCVRKTFINPDIRKKNGTSRINLQLSPMAESCQALQRSDKSQLQSYDSSVNRLFGCASLALSYFPQPLTYETYLRKDTRYVSENFLSVAFAYCLSLRASSRDAKCIEVICESNPDLSYDDCVNLFEADKQVSREYRERMLASSLRDFYQSNMWNHREFDE